MQIKYQEFKQYVQPQPLACCGPTCLYIGLRLLGDKVVDIQTVIKHSGLCFLSVCFMGFNSAAVVRAATSCGYKAKEIEEYEIPIFMRRCESFLRRGFMLLRINQGRHWVLWVAMNPRRGNLIYDPQEMTPSIWTKGRLLGEAKFAEWYTAVGVKK